MPTTVKKGSRVSEILKKIGAIPKTENKVPKER